MTHHRHARRWRVRLLAADLVVVLAIGLVVVRAQRDQQPVRWVVDSVELAGVRGGPPRWVAWCHEIGQPHWRRVPLAPGQEQMTLVGWRCPT